MSIMFYDPRFFCFGFWRKRWTEKEKEGKTWRRGMAKNMFGKWRYFLRLEKKKTEKKGGKYYIVSHLHQKYVFWRLPKYPARRTRSLKSTHTAHMCRGPKNVGRTKKLGDQKLGSSKGWEDQSAEKTNNWKDKKIFNKQMGHRKLKYFIEIYALFGRTKQTKNLRWEDQNRF